MEDHKTMLLLARKGGFRQLAVLAAVLAVGQLLG
jgi:hypothetical protein